VKRRTRFLLLAAVTVAAMTMVLIGTFEASVPFVAPGDLTDEHEGRRVQVEGIVETMTVRPDHLLLELSDDGAATAQVRYAYAGQRPLTLEEGRLVVAKGVYREGVVEANQISVRAHEAEATPSS
jgi:cytochrome c-type biogenesis protein CcmE